MAFFISNAPRNRVERLLRDDIRIQDLNELFFDLRDEAGGRGVVSEIAHFLAHPETRTQGIVTRELRDQFGIMKLRANLATSRVIRTALPLSMPEALRGNLRRMRKSTLKRETGANPVHAKRVLERILARMVPVGPGDLSKPRILNKEEHDIFVCVASHVKGGPIFTDEDLFKDFCSILQKRGALQKSEASTLRICQSMLSLFALTSMQNSTIDLNDGSVATIHITRDMYGNLGTFAYANLVFSSYGLNPTDAAAWVFQTNLPTKDFCEKDVEPLVRGPFIGNFEITADQKLTRLV